ncbi:hypothetical protein STEG23_002876, partial [Scotinomys teguina]
MQAERRRNHSLHFFPFSLGENKIDFIVSMYMGAHLLAFGCARVYGCATGYKRSKSRKEKYEVYDL